MRNAIIVCCCSLPLVAACHWHRHTPAPDAPWPAATWCLLPSPTTASLRGLAVVDANVVWIGGSGGALLRTIDGGATWTNVAPPDSAACDFRDVEAFDAHCAVAMVAGQPAKVVRTIDGGRSWSVVLEDPRPEAFLDTIAFRGDEGLLVGDPVDGAFCVWRSHDAGRTWRPVARELLPIPVSGEASFAASGRCAAFFADGEGRPCFVTGGSATRCVIAGSDGGSWRESPLPLLHGTAAQGAFAIACGPGGAHAVVVGGDHEHPTSAAACSAYTDDGGASWHPAAFGVGGYRSAVVWLDRSALLAVGGEGGSLSLDRGRSWRPFGEQGFHSVAVGRDGAVFACGAAGRVARLVATR